MDRVDQPLQISAPLVAKPWGGRRLADWGRVLPDEGTWGESWDVSDLDPAATTQSDPASRVLGGPFDGQRLEDLIASHREDLLGASADVNGRFPLLVKTLDAREHLSVQVHPPAAWIHRDPTANLKTESWVVLDATPGAGMWIGLDHDVSAEQLHVSASTPAVTELLSWIPARPGAVHHLPAGVVHALGAGVMVAEVQTPSDTTFRLYDWTREYGRAPRDLHVDEALAAMEMAWQDNIAPPAPRDPDDDATTIVSTPDYRLDRHRLSSGDVVAPAGGHARVVMVLEGTATLTGRESLSLSAGGVAVAPAAWIGEVTTPSRAGLLVVTALPGA